MARDPNGNGEIHTRMPTSPASRLPLVFIFLTILIDTIGFGIVLPVLPTLIIELTGKTLSEASIDAGWLALAFAAMQFVFGPVMGNLSDRFGRRPVLLVSLVAFGLDYLLMAVAPTISLLFVGRALAGIAGAAHAPANAYIADITPPEKRAQSFGLLGAAFGLGFILGPALGGLLGGWGTRAPFWVAAGCAFVNAAFGLLVLPESLSPANRRTFTWGRANPFGSFARLKESRVVLDLAAALFLWQLAHQVLPTTWAFFTMLRFNWSEGAVGASLAFAGVAMALVQGYGTRRLIPWLGERRAASFGLVMGVLGFLGYAFATRDWMMYFWIAGSSLSGLVFPSIRAIMSRQMPANEQGELQGAISSMYGLTSIIGPPLMTRVFSVFAAKPPWHFAGAAFLFAGMLSLASLALFQRARPEGIEVRA